MQRIRIQGFAVAASVARLANGLAMDSGEVEQTPLERYPISVVSRPAVVRQEQSSKLRKASVLSTISSSGPPLL